MKDTLKRNMPLIVLLGITLFGSVILGYMIFASQARVGDLRTELDSIKNEKTSIKGYDIKLDNQNQRLAKENAVLVWQQYDTAFAELNGKYQKAQVTDELKKKDPTEAKLFVSGWCEVKRELLEGTAQTKCEGSIRYFTFENVAAVPTLPAAKDVSDILHNVLIVDEVVSVLSECGFEALNSLSRGENLNMIDNEGDYLYKPFTMKATGDYSAIRTFVNRIQDAKYLFIIRKMQMNAEDLTANLGGGSAQESRQGSSPRRAGGKTSKADAGVKVQRLGKSKESRIAFDTMARVTLDIEFDYIELTQHKQEGGK